MVFILVLIGLLVRYVQLHLQLRSSQAHWLACREYLLELGQEFGRYAFSHQGLLPEKLDTVRQVLPESACEYVYRFVPELARDDRLILAYEKEPAHALMAFPKLSMGRNVLFASGKVELFEEGVLHQLIIGDNVLRSRLDLPEIPFMEVWDGRD